MATEFFNSWALWEKMTFILALAILIVFGFGYGKLAWQNRLLKKHQAVEEERQIKVMEMKRSGRPIETQKTDEIPFGVRAIQSGIQVDGIWVSNGSTPLPSPKLSQKRKRSPDFTTSMLNMQGYIDSSKQPAGASLSRGRHPLRQTELGYSLPEKSIGGEVDAKDVHALHKPRRSSQLRFGNYGELPYDESTLGRLGATPSSRSSVVDSQSHNLELERGADETAGYSQHLSGSTLERTQTESDATYMASPVQSSPPCSFQTQGFTQSSWSRYSPLSESLKGEYLSIPFESPDDQMQIPYFEPQDTLSEANLLSKARKTEVHEELTTDISDVSFLSQTPLPSRLPSPFIAGELHMNKTARKVNSGFELLPAGTFGMPVTPSDEKEIYYEEKWTSDEDKRHSKKLQKKTRTSMSSARYSMDRP